MLKKVVLGSFLFLYLTISLFSQNRLQKKLDSDDPLAVILETKSKLDKIKKKGSAKEYDQFPYLVLLASSEFAFDYKKPEAKMYFEEGYKLHKKIITKGHLDNDYWQYVWVLANLAEKLGKPDDCKELFNDLIGADLENNFLANEEDSVSFLDDYSAIFSLYGQNEQIYGLATNLPDRASFLQLTVVEALVSDQKMVQAEQLLVHGLGQLKALPAAQLDKNLYFNYLFALTNLYVDLESFSKAQTYLLEAGLSASQNEATLPHLQIDSYRLNGDYYAALGNQDRAVFNYKQCLRLSKDAIVRGQLMVKWAEVESNRQREDSLLVEGERILRSLARPGSIDMGIGLYSLAIAHKDYRKQLPLYRESLLTFSSLFPKKDCFYLSRIYSGMGIAHIKLKQYDSAGIDFRKSKELSEALGIKCNKCHGLALIGIGDVELNQDSTTAALFSYTDAQKFYQDIFGLHHSYARLAASRIIDYRWSYFDHETDKLFTASFAETGGLIKAYFPALTEQDREKFYESIRKDYDKYPSFVMDARSRRPELVGSLYNHQLQTKAFLLNNFSQWKNRIMNSGDIKLIRELDRWQTNKELLAKATHLEMTDARSLHINIDSLSAATNQLEQQLYEKAQSYTTEIDHPATWQEVRSKLQESEAAIEIVRFNRYEVLQHTLSDSVIYCALIVTKYSQTPDLVVLDFGSKLETKYLNAYRNLAYLQVEDKISYDIFWKRINEHLKGVKRIYFSPDGAFHQININTLKDPSTGKYVSEQYDIIQLTNTKEILLGKREELFNKTGLLFGSPDFFSGDNELAANFRAKAAPPQKTGNERGIDLQDLPGTLEEVENVSAMMKEKGWNVQVFTGKFATEENLKSNYKPRVLHIATHGYFDLGKFSDLSFVKSGLVFSGGGKTLNNYLDYKLYKPEGEDGILTPFEAMDLNLENTDLVVLSACQSGMGEVKPGEGIYGLQRAFKMAGARSLVLTLWPVDDAATKEFMTTFYTHWLISGASKGDAFKTARENLRKKYPQPYYWGAFILVGI